MLGEHSLSCRINFFLPPWQVGNQSQAGRECQHNLEPPVPLPVVPSLWGIRQYSHLPAPPSPTKATLQVICSRARGGSCRKLSIIR